jgi:hypothetical protein
MPSDAFVAQGCRDRWLGISPRMDVVSGRLRRLEAELERVRQFAGLEGVRFGEGWLQGPG